MSEIDDVPLASQPDEPRERVLVRRRSRRFRKRRIVRRIVWLLGAIALVTVVQFAWALFNLHGVVDKMRSAVTATRAGDLVGARAYIADAHGAATRASWGTWGPQFWLVEQVPFVGDNVRAIRVMSTAARDITGPVSDDLLSLQTQLAPKRIRPVNSYVNPQYFVEAQPAAQDLARRMAPVQSRTDVVPTGGLIPGLAESWAKFRSVVDNVGFAAQLTDNVVRMLPAGLGTHGTRRYLIVFQNNAEFRSTGGIPGAFSELTVTDGHLTLGPKQSAATVPQFSQPVLPLTAEETALYGTRPAEFTQDVNLTPDFPRSAHLLAAMWQQHSGHRVDGVFSIDPVALSYVLRGTGPVAASNGVMLTAQDAVGQLLNAPYVSLGAYSEQEDYFASAVHNVFDALVHGQGDAGVALKGVFDGVDQGRAMVWMAAPSEQGALLDAPVTKRLSSGFSHRPDVGVYLNDATSTKLDYYVTSTTSVTSSSCPARRQVLDVTTTVRSYVPSDILANMALRTFLIGNPRDGKPGDLDLSVYAYGPYGGTLLDTTIDGQAGSPRKLQHSGHPVVERTLLIKPGQTITLRYRFQAMKGETGDPSVRATPAAFGDGLGVISSSSC